MYDSRKICSDKESENLLEAVKKVEEIHQTSESLKLSFQTFKNDSINEGHIITLLKQLNPLVNVQKDYHFVLVLDCSGSMESRVNGVMGVETRWNALVGAVNKFIELRRNSGSSDIISIIEYSQKAYIQCEKAPLSEDFKRYLLNHGGGTSFSVGLKSALAVLNRSNHETYTPFLLFMSDGEADDGEQEMTQIFNSHDKNGLIVKVLGFCEGGENKLRKIAKIGRGKFSNSVDGIEIEKTFSKIAYELIQGQSK